MSSPLSINYAAITGASAGIGAAFVRELVNSGTRRLLLIARRREPLEALAQELGSRCEVEILTADLATPEGIQTVVDKLATIPDLDLLINNAGFGKQGTFMEIGNDTHEQMVRLHVEAVSRLSYAVVPSMVRRRKGAIINVASIAAFLPHLTNVNYTATKAYQVNFCRSLNEELAGQGVRIQALCPGLTPTSFHERGGFEDAGKAPAILWTSAEYVVQASFRDLQRNRVVCIPGFVNRVLIVSTRFRVVVWVGRMIVGRVQGK